MNLRKSLVTFALGGALAFGYQANVSSPMPVSSAQSGTWTVQPGNTPNTSAWLFTAVPSTASASALSASAKATVTSSVNVKASAGNVYGVLAMNGAASTCWVQFINSAGAGTLGSGVIFAVPLPASTTQPTWIGPSPIALANFSTGIAVGIATTATGSSACGTGGNLTVFFQ